MRCAAELRAAHRWFSRAVKDRAAVVAVNVPENTVVRVR